MGMRLRKSNWQRKRDQAWGKAKGGDRSAQFHLWKNMSVHKLVVTHGRSGGEFKEPRLLDLDILFGENRTEYVDLKKLKGEIL